MEKGCETVVVVFSMGSQSRALYHIKSAGLHQFNVSATRRPCNITANASLSVEVLDRISGLRLTTRQPHALLHTGSGGSLLTEPVSFTARWCI